MDFDLFGIVGLRLIAPSEAATAALTKRLGAFRTDLEREPDIVVRYRDLSHRPLTFLGRHTAGFDDEGFYLLNRSTGVTEARIPFETIGGRCEIVCRPETRSIPLLDDVIRLTLLARGFVPLHASAFEHEGVGVLVMGWSKGGKTEALLSFAHHGARYVGDEWVVLSGDGREMYGLPIPVTFRPWLFAYVPELVPRVGPARRLLFGGVGLLERIHRLLRLDRRDDAIAKLVDRALPKLIEQRKVTALPQVVFPDPDPTRSVPVDRLLLIMSHSSPDIRVWPGDPADMARRMASSNTFELAPLLDLYQTFRFAFPELRNELLERLEARQEDLLQRAFAHKEAYVVVHPYPVSLERLYRHLRPYCSPAPPAR